MIREISPEELAERLRLQEPTILVDVRQPWEHQLVHIPGSVLAPLGELPDHADDIRAEGETLVVAYCHHGVRSLSGAAMLLRLGFPRVVSLRGGIDAWSRSVDPSLPIY